MSCVGIMLAALIGWTGAARACPGDCNHDGQVTVDELVRAVRIALDQAGISSCDAIDGDFDERAAISELISSVRSAVDGCEEDLPEWRMYGGSSRRLFYNPRERLITPETAASLIPKWRYNTGAIVTASPAVAWVDLPDEGLTQMLFVASWDANLYALRAENGTKVWHYPMKPQPGASYPYASSAAVAWLNGRQVVYVAGGMTMYCIDAATGEKVWEFDAGTGCTTCGFPNPRERNEIESSPVVFRGVVFFGMDVDDGRGKGGMYAVRADDGRLAWYFDLVTGATCRPFPEDNVRRFDGYHTAAELGLPGGEDFFTTRPGCNFDRQPNNCGSVWSSAAVDGRRGLLYTATANCDELVPMPPYDEALLALTLDGRPAWTWRAREVDPSSDDFDFGGVPNLFEAEIGGVLREVVGIGGKDGTYYVIDRDGVNEINGVRWDDPLEIRNPRPEGWCTVRTQNVGLPYWCRRVVEGGPLGGIIASAAVGEGKIFFSTAPGRSIEQPQLPGAWALHVTDGSVAWSNPESHPSFAPVAAVPGLTFMGTNFLGPGHGSVDVYRTADGARLTQLDAKGLPGGASSVPAVVGGMLFVGGGVGTFGRPGSVEYLSGSVDTPISAFCLRGTPGCPDEPLCDDGNPCTYDYRRRDGACASEVAPNTLSCLVGTEQGQCSDGSCVLVSG